MISAATELLATSGIPNPHALAVHSPVALLSVALLLVLTVDRGGALVYRHGVGQTASYGQLDAPQPGAP